MLSNDFNKHKRIPKQSLAWTYFYIKKASNPLSKFLFFYTDVITPA